MRGKRAKILRKKAMRVPSTFVGGYYNGVFVHGGVMRSYKILKHNWRNRGLRTITEKPK